MVLLELDLFLRYKCLLKCVAHEVIYLLRETVRNQLIGWGWVKDGNKLWLQF